MITSLCQANPLAPVPGLLNEVFHRDPQIAAVAGRNASTDFVIGRLLQETNMLRRDTCH